MYKRQVGDRLYTDVACGTKNGAIGILVMTGETTPEMLSEDVYKRQISMFFVSFRRLFLGGNAFISADQAGNKRLHGVPGCLLYTSRCV